MLGQSHSHISTWTVIHDQIEARWTLESIVKSNDELVLHLEKYISFRLGISNQILREDFFLFENFHGKELVIWVVLLLHQEDRTKGPFA